MQITRKIKWQSLVAYLLTQTLPLLVRWGVGEVENKMIVNVNNAIKVVSGFPDLLVTVGTVKSCGPSTFQNEADTRCIVSSKYSV